MDKYMAEALKEAQKGLQEGGIPIGSILVIDGKIVGRGHNRRVQKVVLFYMQRWIALRMLEG